MQVLSLGSLEGTQAVIQRLCCRDCLFLVSLDFSVERGYATDVFGCITAIKVATSSEGRHTRTLISLAHDTTRTKPGNKIVTERFSAPRVNGGGQ